MEPTYVTNRRLVVISAALRCATGEVNPNTEKSEMVAGGDLLWSREQFDILAHDYVISDEILRTLLGLFMSADPYPGTDEENIRLWGWLDEVAKLRGYESWVQAYHEMSRPEGDLPLTFPDRDEEDVAGSTGDSTGEADSSTSLSDTPVKG